MRGVTAYHGLRYCNILICVHPECSFSDGTKISFCSLNDFCSSAVVLRVYERVMPSSANVRVIQSKADKNALCHKRPLTSLQLSAVSFVKFTKVDISYFVIFKLLVVFAFRHNFSIIIVLLCYY